MPPLWIVAALGLAAVVAHFVSRKQEQGARDDLDREAARVVAELLARGGGRPAIDYEAVAAGRGDATVRAEVERRVGAATVAFERRRDGRARYVFVIRAEVDGVHRERERPIDFDELPAPIREDFLRDRGDRVERPYRFAPEVAS